MALSLEFERVILIMLQKEFIIASKFQTNVAREPASDFATKSFPSLGLFDGSKRNDSSKINHQHDRKVSA